MKAENTIIFSYHINDLQNAIRLAAALTEQLANVIENC